MEIFNRGMVAIVMDGRGLPGARDAHRSSELAAPQALARMSEHDSKHAFGTRVVHGGQRPDPLTGAVMPPIYATSTYVQSSPGVHQGLRVLTHGKSDAGRACRLPSPIWRRGHAGFAFASGMAATATVLELLDAGSHIVAMHDLIRRQLPHSRECAQALRRPMKSAFVDLTERCRAHPGAATRTRACCG